MRALLDARLGRRPTGIGNYVIQLASGLAELAPGEVRVVSRPRHWLRFAAAGLRPVLDLRGGRAVPRLPASDLIHGPNFHAPEVPDHTVRVATIHDLGYRLLPECHPPGMPERLDRLVRASIPGTRLFLCNSRDTAAAFASEYDVEARRIAVTPLAVDAARFSRASDNRDASLRRIARHGLKQPYVLFVGAMVPRKDLRTLLQAWAEVARDDTQLGLVLAGSKTLRWASDWPHVEAWLRANPRLANRVKVLDYVAEPDLPALYAGAEVVMLTSLLEGFGLTVLEAMAACRPVVATDSGALPEVGGTAAYYGQARQPESFAAALRAALAGEDLERRAREAQAIVAAHTWRRTAELTLDAYRAAVADPLP